MIGTKKTTASMASTGAARPVGPSAARISGKYIQPSTRPANTHRPAKTVEDAKDVPAGRRRRARRMLPIDSRSSLAARREKTCSSLWCTSAAGAEEMPGHCSSSAALTVGVGGLPACASAAASRAESASWIAESAASVGSLIFFGVFAMSVVASYYAELQQRQEREP